MTFFGLFSGALKLQTFFFKPMFNGWVDGVFQTNNIAQLRFIDRC